MKTQEFLAKAGIEPKTETNAKKETWGRQQAIELLSNATSLHSAKGKKVVSVDLKDHELSEEELLKLMLGPTGNLRAPTLRAGKCVIVGFNEDMYRSLL